MTATPHLDPFLVIVGLAALEMALAVRRAVRA